MQHGNHADDGVQGDGGYCNPDSDVDEGPRGECCDSQSESDNDNDDDDDENDQEDEPVASSRFSTTKQERAAAAKAPKEFNEKAQIREHDFQNLDITNHAAEGRGPGLTAYWAKLTDVLSQMYPIASSDTFFFPQAGCSTDSATLAECKDPLWILFHVRPNIIMRRTLDDTGVCVRMPDFPD